MRCMETGKMALHTHIPGINFGNEWYILLHQWKVMTNFLLVRFGFSEHYWWQVLCF